MKDEQRSIMRHMQILNNAIRRHIDRNFECKKDLDKLSGSGGWILSRIFESEHNGEPLYQRDFEDEFGITRSTASKMLSSLEQKGLVERTKVSSDGRLKRILPTEHSKKIGESIYREMSKLEKQLESEFTPKELETLYGFFERIEKNIAAAETRSANKINTKDHSAKNTGSNKEAQKIDKNVN